MTREDEDRMGVVVAILRKWETRVATPQNVQGCIAELVATGYCHARWCPVEGRLKVDLIAANVERVTIEAVVDGDVATGGDGKGGN